MTDRRFLPLDTLEVFVKKVEKLRAEGLSVRTVAERLGVGTSTVTERVKRWNDLQSESASKVKEGS